MGKAYHAVRDWPGGTSDPETARNTAATRAAVLGHGDVLALHDRETGEAAGRFTTIGVRQQEREALADGAAVAGPRQHRGIPGRHQEAALASRSLRDDQRSAFDHAVAEGGLKIIEGRAGTGKSFTLAAIRDAHERAGDRVVGLAPTNAVAQDLKADGFREASTVHSALFSIKNGRGLGWDKHTVLIVDEAAMLDTRITGELRRAHPAAGICQRVCRDGNGAGCARAGAADGPRRGAGCVCCLGHCGRSGGGAAVPPPRPGGA